MGIKRNLLKPQELGPRKMFKASFTHSAALKRYNDPEQDVMNRDASSSNQVLELNKPHSTRAGIIRYIY